MNTPATSANIKHILSGVSSFDLFISHDICSNILQYNTRLHIVTTHIKHINILKGFSVGSVRRFVMSVPKQIEDPSVLRIWHDNSGSGNDASWYLSKVILEDIQTQDK